MKKTVKKYAFGGVANQATVPNLPSQASSMAQGIMAGRRPAPLNSTAMESPTPAPAPSLTTSPIVSQPISTAPTGTLQQSVGTTDYTSLLGSTPKTTETTSITSDPFAITKYKKGGMVKVRGEGRCVRPKKCKMY